MNYEELLTMRDGGVIHREETPLGLFCKKLIDRKYRNVVVLKPSLVDSIVFCEGLKSDLQNTSAIMANGQLHYEIHSDSGGFYELELEQGNFTTFAQLIDSTPAVVTESNFIKQTTDALFDIAGLLHERGIYHLCFSPQNVFISKGDNRPMLLCHGSSFIAMVRQDDLYDGSEHFVAPEVLNEHVANECSDVYSLGRFLEWLFQHGSIPFEYRKMIEKATQDDPKDRYASIADMRNELQKKRKMKYSFFTMLAAVAIVILCVGLYFEMMPQTADIEFVEGFSTEQKDPFSEEYSPDEEFGFAVDTLDTLSIDERAQMEDYQRKAEEIFRRQYRREADRIISKLYSQQGMSLDENVFVASSNAMTAELINLGKKLADDAGITEDKAMRMAAEINEELTNEKEKNLVLMGAQTGSKE